MPYQDPNALPIDPPMPGPSLGKIAVSSRLASNDLQEVLLMLLEEMIEVKEAVMDLASYSGAKSLRREVSQSKGTKTGRKMSSKEGVI